MTCRHLHRPAVATARRGRGGGVPVRATLAILAGGMLAAGFLAAPAISAPVEEQAAGWTLQEPQPSPWPFRDVDMISTTEGWTVARPDTGDHGVVMHTTDGGVSWSQQGGEFRQLDTVSFVDDHHGIALGNELRYTTNGGRTWRSGTGVVGTIYDAELATAAIGYGAGGDRVIKTVDGGASWTSTVLPVEGNLVAVDVIDASNVVVVGAEGSVFRTTNGGAKWTQLRHDADMFYTGVSFISPTEGWISGDAPPTILHTTDGGAHWSPQTVPLDGDAARIRMVDAQHGWAVGALRTILHTDNGGETWALQQGGVRADPNNRYPYWGIDAVDATHAVSVGAGVQIATTTDAGQIWRVRGNGSTTVPYRLVHTDALHVWAANSDSEVLYSTDGGVRWSRSIIQEEISCERCSNVSDLTFLNDHEGWATINGEFTTSSWIWHTTDGGVTWQSLDVTDTGPLTGIAAIDSHRLIAVSASSDDLIFRSTDGGQSWRAVAHPHVGGFFGAVRFLAGTRSGWAVGYGGKILHSANAGRTWTLQHGTGADPSLFDVSFSDPMHGWAVGGEVLRTTDGGATWKRQPTAFSVVFGVSSPTRKVAWLAGVEGVASTTTGGSHWSQAAPVAGAWYSVTSLDATTAWAGMQEEIDDVPGAIWLHGPKSRAAERSSPPAGSPPATLRSPLPPSTGL